jgi:hypothetical protein
MKTQSGYILHFIVSYAFTTFEKNDKKTISD